jgi:hypothetical protein
MDVVGWLSDWVEDVKIELMRRRSVWTVDCGSIIAIEAPDGSLDSWRRSGRILQGDDVWRGNNNMNGSYFRFLTLLYLRHDDALTDSA